MRDRLDDVARRIYEHRFPNGAPLGGPHAGDDRWGGASWAEIEMRSAQALAQALNEARMVCSGPTREEWAAVVGWRNHAGQTEQARGYGDSREAALDDARRQPRMLLTTDAEEIQSKVVRRYVTDWEQA